jgi:hypothetical protein
MNVLAMAVTGLKIIIMLIIKQKIIGVCITAWLKREKVKSLPKDSFLRPDALQAEFAKIA